jgi:hypothetical protein
MKLSYFIVPLLLLGGPLLAREIATEEPVTITGKLSVSNSFVYITTDDTLSGRGNGVELHKEPVHRFVVSTDALPPNRQKSRAEELKKLAAAGKPVTLKGSFHALAFKGAEYYHSKAFLELSE